MIRLLLLLGLWDECTERKRGCWGTSLAPDKCCLNGREGALGQSQEHVPWEALPALPALWVGAAFLANPPAPPQEECSPPPGLWSHKAGPSAGLSPWQNSLMLKIDYATERTRERPFYEPKEAVAWAFLSSSEGPGTLREGTSYGKTYQVSKEHKRGLWADQPLREDELGPG